MPRLFSGRLAGGYISHPATHHVLRGVVLTRRAAHSRWSATSDKDFDMKGWSSMLTACSTTSSVAAACIIRRMADACRTDEDIDAFNLEVRYYFTYNLKVSNTRRYDDCWWPKDRTTFRVVDHHQTSLTMFSHLNLMYVHTSSYEDVSVKIIKQTT